MTYTPVYGPIITKTPDIISHCSDEEAPYDSVQSTALGAESWVQNILQKDSLTSQTDHLGEIWASELPILPIVSPKTL